MTSPISPVSGIDPISVRRPPDQPARSAPAPRSPPVVDPPAVILPRTAAWLSLAPQLVDADAAESVPPASTDGTLPAWPGLQQLA